jgi:hypothetical protein
VREHSRPVSRRTLLAGTALGGAGAVLLGGTGFPALADVGALDQFDAMRATWCDLLTGGEFDGGDPEFAAALERLSDSAEANLGLIDREADRPGVFTDLPFVVEDTYDASNRVQATLLRLEQLATTYRTPGSRYEGDPDVLADILAGLDTTNRKVYHAGREEFGNWYVWEIGGANALVNACALVYEHVPAEALSRYLAAIDHFIPDPHYQYIDERRHLSIGSNRLYLCQAVTIRGLLGRDSARIDLARDGVSDEFAFVSSGDGFYRDGSYLFHSGCAYTGSYGLSFVNQFSKLLVLYTGTPWEIGGAEQDFAYATIDRSFAPLIYDGRFMDCARGRSISRAGGDHVTGHQALEVVLRLAEATDAETAARWRAMAKGWLERDTYDDPSSDASVPRLALLKALREDSSVRPAPEPVRHVLFASMDRAVHRRPGWAFAVSMSSARVSFYEVAGDRENVKGWHTGAGMTYLYDSDNGQFTDDFWPTVDPYRLPGTTVDTRRLAELVGVRSRPDTRWVGGSVLGGEFAAIGMDLATMESPLRARKSWFCLDNSVVALGSGITGGGGHYAGVVADAHVNAGTYANTNYGSDNRLLVKKASADGTREAYLAFDLSGVEGRVLSASLHFYARVEDAGGTETDVDVHGVTGSWSENTLTWNTKPAAGSRLGSAHVDSERKWRTVEVTPHVVQQLAAGKRRVSVALRQNPPGGSGLSVWIASREYSGYAYDPYLYLTLETPAHTVETVVENRNLHAGGDNALLVDGVAQPVEQGWAGQFTSARWAQLEGVGGYLFPGGAALHALRESRTGAWSDINGGGSPTPITRRYLTLWFDHGANPNGGSYAYALLPGASAERTAALAAKPGFEIVANSPNVHAVRAPGLGLTAVNFWRAGTIAGITVDRPCSVVVREDAAGLAVAVADPLQQQASVAVKLARPGYRTWTGDSTITVQAVRPTIQFRANTSGAQGRSHQVTFRR